MDKTAPIKDVLIIKIHILFLKSLNNELKTKSKKKQHVSCMIINDFLFVLFVVLLFYSETFSCRN